MNELYELVGMQDHGTYVSGRILLRNGNEYISYTVYPPKHILRDGNKVSKNAIKKYAQNPALRDMGVL